MEQSKLTYREGYHSIWEGVEMTEEAMQERFGCLDLMYNVDDEIIGYLLLEKGEENAYIIADSERSAILKLIEDRSVETESHSYDNALDERHGFARTSTSIAIFDIEELKEAINNFKLSSQLPSTVKVKDFEEFLDAVSSSIIPFTTPK